MVVKSTKPLAFGEILMSTRRASFEVALLRRLPCAQARFFRKISDLSTRRASEVLYKKSLIVVSKAGRIVALACASG